MTTRASDATEVLVGAPVFSFDGYQVGSVKDMSDACFKVNAPMQRDYWLSRDCVASVVGGAVWLSISRDQLRAAKVHRPERRSVHRRLRRG